MSGATKSAALPTLCNAAQEFIAERIQCIEANACRDYSDEDIASVHREREQIEAEIKRLLVVMDALRVIGRMRHPSVAALLRKHGSGYEAAQIEAVLAAAQACESPHLYLQFPDA
jgi:hypothetical protein